MVVDIEFLEEKARQIRIEIVKMLTNAGSGHTGGSLSATDIVTALYFYKMKHNPKNPQWKERDRFVLSKGHAAPVLYAALALSGYFDKSLLNSLRKLGSPLQGHPCCKNLPGVEVSTGSLGQGLSVACGMALGLRLSGINSRVYCLLGDGELQEGQVWEAAMTASHYKIDNLCAVVDHNNLQIDGHCSDVMNIKPIEDKFIAFGWNVFTIDGHNMQEIVDALEAAEKTKGKPTMIIANTVKGKGVSIFEGKVQYHGVAPTQEELEIALKELKNGKN
ncbi:transketolase [Thermodesulfovibrio yellowstonii]|jgi:transketolase|uniref:transketolase n=1 Tax=Thermodesulfovibrio yellowstonii TaxID=28262 RepID=UPI0013E8DDE8|nr:transketolase [Thermodesulfovibrio yellowstonii]MDI6865199.1 transketolase [Thermodesulfovibrio yellowstonii]